MRIGETDDAPPTNDLVQRGEGGLELERGAALAVELCTNRVVGQERLGEHPAIPGRGPEPEILAKTRVLAVVPVRLAQKLGFVEAGSRRLGALCERVERLARGGPA